ncbi:MAG: glycosyltransferase [Coriobacteriia bacterium]
MRLGRGRLRGVTFAKQFPNAEEPYRGLFVAEQLRATRDVVDWRVIAPVPFVPRALAEPLGKPYVKGVDSFEGIPVARPRYPVLPRRILYTTVAPAVAAASARAFSEAVEVHEPHFVHAHDLYPSGAAARRLTERSDLPLVVTVHGSDLYSNLVRPAWRREIREVCDAASAVVCVSSGLADDLVAELGVDEWKVQVIPDTYDEASFGLAPREREAGRAVRLLTVCNLVEVKGLDVLVDAVAMLVEDGRDITLEIVGKGPLRGMLEERSRARGIRGNVFFTGSVPREEIVAAMRRADLFVLASHREGFGVVLIEAMATGLPVVATAVEGPRDIVRDEDGILVPPGDPVALAEGIGNAVDRLDSFDPTSISRGVSERYGHHRVGRMLVELYEVVAGASGAASPPGVGG